MNPFVTERDNNNDDDDNDMLSQKMFNYSLSKSTMKPMGAPKKGSQGNNFVQGLTTQQLIQQNALRKQHLDSFKDADYDSRLNNRIMSTTRLAAISHNRIPQQFSK